MNKNPVFRGLDIQLILSLLFTCTNGLNKKGKAISFHVLVCKDVGKGIFGRFHHLRINQDYYSSTEPFLNSETFIFIRYFTLFKIHLYTV